jgi:putative transposase
MPRRSPFRYFRAGPAIIRVAGMLYVRFPPSWRNVQDVLHDRGIEISHGAALFWWNRFAPMFAAESLYGQLDRMRAHRHWRWHLDEQSVKINGVTHCLWQAVDNEGDVLDRVVTGTQDRKAALGLPK